MLESLTSATSWIEFIWANKFAVLGWTIAAVAFVLIPFRRSPAEARGWLLIFFALPWLALVAYAIVGRPSPSAKRLEQIRKLPGLYAQMAERTGVAGQGFAPALSSDNTAVARLAEGLGHFPPLKGNSIEPLAAYHETYDRIIEEIAAARDHVHLQFYIFANDEIGKRIMLALEEAQGRGVRCRVLLDSLGSFPSVGAIKRRLSASNIEVHDVLPMRRRWRGSRVDLRNHRKIIVIDGQVGFTGSQNLWDPSVRSLRGNRDLLVRVTGPVVGQLQAVFVGDWFLETDEQLAAQPLFPKPLEGGDMDAQIIASGPDYPEGGVDLIFTQAMYNAAEEIVITSPYFIPNEALISAIKAAILGGVKVVLITPRRSDHLIVQLAQRSYYEELLAAGMEIHLYGPEFLHAKHFRVDTEICVLGSSNMDVRSFELNAEADLICYEARFAETVRALEADYLAQAEPLSLVQWQRRPLSSKVLENSARLISDLI